jgi:hypothetical protein
MLLVADKKLRIQRAVGAGLSTVWTLAHRARRDVVSAGHFETPTRDSVQQ